MQRFRCQLVSSTAAARPQGSGRNVTWNLGTVKPGQQLEFTITAKGNAAGEQGITTTTKSDQLRLTVENDEQVTYIDR